MIISTPYPSLMNAMDKALSYLTKDCKSMLDVGSCHGSHTKLLSIPEKLFIDIEDHSEDPDTQPFKQMRAQDISSVFGTSSYDVVIALDFIEHLTEEDALNFLHDAELIAAKRVIIFTPEGITLKYGDHLSGWFAAEFEDLQGYQVWLCPDFHPTLNAGAFLAWKTVSGEEITPEQLRKICQ